MRISGFFILCLYLPLQTLAQQEDRCGTVPYLEMLKAKDPSIPLRMQKNESVLQQQIQTMASRASSAPIRTVPVVIHILWHLGYQNICDALVQSQIRVLNEDYAHLNADTTDTPEPFKNLGEDSGIRFVLANRDPQGNVTGGVIRKYVSSGSFLFGNSMKFDSLGGSDQWDPDRYLNIWVCNLEGTVLGYATLPGTANPGEDGVVIAARAFGKYSYDPSGKYNLGRTTTHEVGHWFNLYHIWGDDGGDCSGSDYVSDTPNQDNYTFGCPDFPQKSCGNGPDGNMFVNFMDYTDDRCMNLFTKGQNQRMQAALDLLRPGIQGSNGYVPDSNQVTMTRTGDIIVAPNPFTEGFDIHVQLKKLTSVEVDVMDISGKVVLREKFPECFCESFHMDMRTFQRGLYLARIRTHDETRVVKLLLQK